MIVRTNHIDIEPYRLNFEAIYAKHSSTWAKWHNEHLHHMSASIDIGEYYDWVDDYESEQIDFLDYIAAITGLSLHILGQIDTLVVSGLNTATRQYYVLKEFKLASV